VASLAPRLILSHSQLRGNWESWDIAQLGSTWCSFQMISPEAQGTAWAPGKTQDSAALRVSRSVAHPVQLCIKALLPSVSPASQHAHCCLGLSVNCKQFFLAVAVPSSLISPARSLAEHSWGYRPGESRSGGRAAGVYLQQQADSRPTGLRVPSAALQQGSSCWSPA